MSRIHMTQSTIIAVDTGRYIRIDHSVMTVRRTAARLRGRRPGKEICDMAAMGIGRCLLVPMTGQTTRRIRPSGNDVSHRLSWNYQITSQTLSIMAGSTNSASDAMGMDDLDSSPGRYNMAVRTWARITDRRLANVGRLNGNAVRVRMSVKEGDMAGDTLSTTDFTRCTTDQSTVDLAMAEIAGEPLVDFAAANKG